MEMTVTDPRPAMIATARRIYSRFLSDSAGGNISVRAGEHIYVSPRYMGSRYHYEIETAQISVVAAGGRVVEGPTDLSREVRLHLRAYERLPEVGAVIHAHPRWLMVYAAAGRDMPPVLEYTDKYGVVECVPEVRAHSQELADEVLRVAERRQAQLEKAALAVLLPRHGIAVLGRDLDDAYDALERLENNARCALLSRLLPPEGAPT